VATNRQLLAPDDSVLERMRAEFLDMPGLCLTFQQARRLWSLDARTCETALARLVAARFLARRPDGLYARSSEALTSLCAPTAA
jgi:hypothetical protein